MADKVSQGHTVRLSDSFDMEQPSAQVASMWSWQTNVKLSDSFVMQQPGVQGCWGMSASDWCTVRCQLRQSRPPWSSLSMEMCRSLCPLRSSRCVKPCVRLSDRPSFKLSDRCLPASEARFTFSASNEVCTKSVNHRSDGVSDGQTDTVRGIPLSNRSDECVHFQEGSSVRHRTRLSDRSMPAILGYTYRGMQSLQVSDLSSDCQTTSLIFNIPLQL